MARPRSDDKRLSILLSAIRLFAEEGLSAPTARIAKEAGVAVGSLFTYFPTKDDLENQVYLHLKSQLREALSPPPPNAGLREQVHHAWGTYVHWGLTHPQERTALNKLAVSPRMTPSTKTEGREVFCEVSRLLEQAKASGVLRDQPVDFAEALMGAMAEATVELIHHSHASEAATADLGFQCFWNAITVDGSPRKTP